MDSSAGKSPRRELQGPRPTPLRVRKESYKIRKPPAAPQPSQPLPQPRPPIIIYAVSPKVIHTNPSEFMALVQRLTGSSSSTAAAAAAAAATTTSSSTFVANNNPWTENNGAISPAARYASLEKTKSPQGKKQPSIGSEDLEVIEGIEIINHGVERTSNTIPGILSPGPGSLQPIPSTFFSPPSDQNPLGFLHDLSPAIFSARHHLADNNNFLLPSPSTTFVSPHNLTNSPFPSLDLFNNFFDL